MTELVYLAIFVGLLLCLLNFPLGMLITLLAGFLQDFARKIVPDEPIYLTVVVLLFAAATFTGAFGRGSLPSFKQIPDWNREMKWAAELFVIIVVLQSLAAYLYTSSIVLAGIGLLVYLSPFPAFLMAYGYASSSERIIAFLRLYMIASVIASAGIYLSWLGFEWSTLRSVGEPLVVYSMETGEALALPAGFMRTPEIAAWHAATGFCLAVVLGTVSRRTNAMWASMLLGAFFMGAVLLTGRRKFLLEIAAFLLIFLIFNLRFRIGSAKLIKALVATALVGSILAIGGILTDDTVTRLGQASLRHEESAFQDVLDRFMNLTFGAFGYIIDTNGFFGSGAGSGSQGAQYFGGGDELVGLAAEGGLGKILAELGVPGLLAFLWVAFRFSRYLWRTLNLLQPKDHRIGYMTLGLAAFLGANAIVFVSAHQVFGDPFVLLVIGCSLGFIVAARRIVVATEPSSTQPASPFTGGRSPAPHLRPLR